MRGSVGEKSGRRRARRMRGPPPTGNAWHMLSIPLPQQQQGRQLQAAVCQPPSSSAATVPKLQAKEDARARRIGSCCWVNGCHSRPASPVCSSVPCCCCCCCCCCWANGRARSSGSTQPSMAIRYVLSWMQGCSGVAPPVGGNSGHPKGPTMAELRQKGGTRASQQGVDATAGWVGEPCQVPPLVCAPCTLHAVKAGPSSTTHTHARKHTTVQAAFQLTGWH